MACKVSENLSWLLQVTKSQFQRAVTWYDDEELEETLFKPSHQLHKINDRSALLVRVNAF